jgi:hypothetical protein
MRADTVAYKIRDLGVLAGMKSCEARGVNDRGEVVG